MQDKESNSLWSHITGICLEGQYKGTELKQMPSVQTTWAKWQVDHPKTRVLKKSEEIKSSQYQSYFDDPDRAGLFRTFWLEDRMPGKAIVQGISIGPHSLAVVDGALKPGVSLTHDLGQTQVVVTRNADGGVRAVRVDSGEELQVLEAFWFAWSSFYPNTAVLDNN